MASSEITEFKLVYSAGEYWSPTPPKSVNLVNKESIQKIDINLELPPEHRRQLRDLLHQFPDIFAEGMEDVRVVNCEPFRIDTGDSKPLRQ